MPADPTMTDPMTPAPPPAAGDDPGKAAEYREVATWLAAYEEGRKFDENAHRQYAIDRRYARGDSGFEVDVNLVGTFIDISASFLYAKQPDVSVAPSPAATLPNADTIAQAAAEVAKVQGQQAGMKAVQAGIPLGLQAGMDVQSAAQAAAEAGKVAEQAAGAQALQMAMQSIQQHFADRQRDAKALAETLELLISKKWTRAQIKKRGRRMVRGALTVGPGILKATWQARTSASPATRTQIRDLQTNLARVQTLLRELAEGSDRSAHEAQAKELREQLATVQAQAEQTAIRDYVAEVVRPENHTITPGYALSDAEEAPWQIERIPMRLALAKDQFPRITLEQWKQATRYQARKPEPLKAASPGEQPIGTVNPKDADGWVVGEAEGGGEPYVMVLEIWDAEANLVRTAVEGVKCWAREAFTPPATTRFYPYFHYIIGETGEERHPMSLVTRSAKMVNEYNRVTSQERKHRKRCLPKMAFNSGQMAPEEVVKLEKGEVGEMVGVKFMSPDADISKILREVAYPAWNPALYDKGGIRNDLETLWGIQEALSGGVEVAKTATEADIQQQGFQSRTGDRREDLDILLNELAQYTAELLRASMSAEEVVALCGPHAYWPEYTDPDTDALRLVTVEIVAGSSGKPNSAKQQESWGVLLPVLQEGINTVGTLRAASPLDMAKAHERLIQLTVERLGERLPLDDLLPQGPGPMPAPPEPGHPGDTPPGQDPQGTPPGQPAPTDPTAPPQPATA